MWLFTRYGFYSIACARKPDGAPDPDLLMVRARRKAHLANLIQRFPALSGGKVVTSADADYRYRLIVAKAEWTTVVAEMAGEQDWSNFKNQAATFQGAAGADYVEALHDVWSVMYGFQATEPE